MISHLSLKDIDRFHAAVRRQDGCWLWQGQLNNQGYGRFSVYKGNSRKRLLAHRVAYTLATGRDIAGLVVRHDCDNPPCCNPEHLRVGTQWDNMRDAATRGRADYQGLVLGQRLQREAVLLRLAMQRKRCRCCGVEKPFEDFSLNRSEADGRQGHCKPCVSQARREKLRNDPIFRAQETARKRKGAPFTSGQLNEDERATERRRRMRRAAAQKDEVA